MTSPASRDSAAGAALDRAAAFVLLFHLAACAGFHQPYARLSVAVGGVPLFTGEAVILVLLLLEAALVVRTRNLPFALRLPDRLLVAYFAIGAAFAAAGLARGFGLAVFRDFALVYYAVFYLFARAFVARGHRATRLLHALAVGATAGAVWQGSRFLLAPALDDGHGAPGVLALAAWLAVVVLVGAHRAFAGPLRRALWLAALAVNCFAIYLSAYRTMIGVAAASLAVVALAAFFARVPGSRGLLARLTAVAAAMVVVVVAHARLMPALTQRFTDRGPVTLADGLGGITSRWSFRLLRFGADGVARAAAPDEPRSPGDPERLRHHTGGFEPSYRFRLLAWRNAIARIRSSPWTGIGFGPNAELFPDSECRLVSSPLSNCGNAHNTYLTLAMRMGIPAFLLFVAINAAVLFPFVARLRRRRADRDDARLAVLLAVAYASCLAYASLSLFFESPYLSPIYWAVLGATAGFALPSGRGLARDDENRRAPGGGADEGAGAAPQPDERQRDDAEEAE